MKKILIFSVALFGIFACGTKQQTEEVTTKTETAVDTKAATTTETKEEVKQEVAPELTMKEETSSCFIKKIYELNGKQYIDVDFVVIEELEEGGMEIVNKNPKIRTYELTQPSYTDCMQDGQVTVEHIKKAVAEDKEEEGMLYYISAKDGQVSTLYLECAG